MAENLLADGHELIVFNRSVDKADSLLENGAKLATGLEDLGKQADVIFTMLSTPAVVKSTAEEFLPYMKEDAWWVDCSTVNPSFSRQMAVLAAKYNLRFVDAPVAGSKAPAEKGELLFLAGGSENALSELQPFFDAMGKKTLYLNNVGNGANVKMLINLLLAQSLATFSEAMKLGLSMGLAEKQLLQILSSTPVVSPVVGLLKERLLNKDFEVNFPLKWIQKDIGLALQTADEFNLSMPSLATTQSLYQEALNNGYGDVDFSAIYANMIA